MVSGGMQIQAQATPVLQYPPVNDEPPPGIFFTEEAFCRYSVLRDGQSTLAAPRRPALQAASAPQQGSAPLQSASSGSGQQRAQPPSEDFLLSSSDDDSSGVASAGPPAAQGPRQEQATAPAVAPAVAPPAAMKGAAEAQAAGQAGAGKAQEDRVEGCGTEPVAVRGADSRGLAAAAPEHAARHAAEDKSANDAVSPDASEGDSDEEAALAAVAAAAEAVAAVTGRAGALPIAAVGPAGAQAGGQRGTLVPAPGAAAPAGADAAHATAGGYAEAVAAAAGREGARAGGAAALAGTQASVQRGAPVPAPAAMADERGAEAPQARRAAAEPDQARALGPAEYGAGRGSAPAVALFHSTKPAKSARTAGVSGACSGAGSGMDSKLSPAKPSSGPPQRPRRVPPGPLLPAKIIGRAPPAHSTEGLGMRAATTHGTGEQAAKERPAALPLDEAAAAAQSQPGAGGDPGGREERDGASGLQRVAGPTGGVPPGGSAGAEVPHHKGPSSVEAPHAVSGKTPRGGPGGGAVKAGGGRGGKRRGLSVADVLNPNNAAYNPGFAAEYATERAAAAAARPASGPSRMAARAPVWSKLSAEEHAWFLVHAGEHLRGRAKAKLDALTERLKAERSTYVEVARASASTDRERYEHMDPRFAALVQARTLGTLNLDAPLRACITKGADAERQRMRVHTLPRLWRLHATLPLAPLAQRTTAKPLKHLRTAAASGAERAFRPLPDGSLLPLGGETPKGASASGGPGASRGMPDPTTTLSAAEAWWQWARGAKGGAAGHGNPIEFHHHPPLAEEPAARAAAAAEGAAAVLAASAFVRLVELTPPGFEPGFEIPVTVLAAADCLPAGAPQGTQQPPLGPNRSACADCSGAGGCAGSATAGSALGTSLFGPGSTPGSTARPAVAFFDKPLLARETTRREQHQRVFKAALLAAGLGGMPPGAGTGFSTAGLLKPMPTGAPPGSPPGDSVLERHGREAASPARSEEDLTAMLEAELCASDADERPGLVKLAEHEADKGAASAGAGARHHSSELRDAAERPLVQYEAWQLGAVRLLTRARTHARTAPPAPYPKPPPATWAEALAAAAPPPQGDAAHLNPGPSTPLVVRASAEYLGERAEDEEEVTPGELARWWAALCLRPGAQLLVGHVGVAAGRLLRSEVVTMADVKDAAAEAGAVAMTFLCAVLAEVVACLSAAPPGRYLLTHAPGGGSLAVWRALPGDLAGAEGHAPPLPCAAAAAAPGGVVDLWAAHANSGGVDPDNVPFTPRRWRPSDPDMPQVPFTFALRPAAPANAGKRGRGGAGEQGSASGRRARVRKLLPSAWTAGHRLDWDEGLGRGEAFSHEDYTRQLAEEWGS